MRSKQESWKSLLCLLPVDGVIQLLHLLVSEDAVSEVGLEFLHGQLPIVCKETNNQTVFITRPQQLYSVSSATI